MRKMGHAPFWPGPGVFDSYCKSCRALVLKPVATRTQLETFPSKGGWSAPPPEVGEIPVWVMAVCPHWNTHVVDCKNRKDRNGRIASCVRLSAR